MVSRYHIQSGHPTVDYTLNALFGTSQIQLGRWIPLHLDRLAASMPGQEVLLLEGLLKNNTLFPLLNLFFGRQEGETRPNYHLMLQSLPKRANSGSGSLRVCLSCLREDAETYGTPYVHLSHQVPGVCVCPKHQVWLIERCPFCKQPLYRGSSLPLALWRPCTCGRSLDSFVGEMLSHEQGVELSYASFCADLLKITGFPIQAEVLREMYRVKLAEGGLYRGRRLDLSAFQEGVETYYGSVFLAKLQKDYGLGDFKNHHRLGVGTIKAVPFIRHLVLAHFLFRTASEFSAARVVAEAHCAEQLRRVEEPAPPPDKDKSIKLFADMLSAARAIPECTLEKLWERHYGLTKRFIKRFPDRIEVLLQEEKSVSVEARKPRRCPLPEQEDQEWANRFKAVADALYQAVDGRPVRVSRTRIQTLSGWKREPLVDAERAPLAWQALEESLESDWHYHARRYAWAVLTVGAEQSWSRIRRTSAVDHDKARELQKFFGGVTHWPNLRSGILTELLDNLGVTRLWSGPCPDKQFFPRGRRYQRKLREPSEASE